MNFPENGFTFYFGGAGGSARKALQQMQEPDVMLSYATKNNTPWSCGSLFVDSGGYSVMMKDDEHDHPWPDEYLDYVESSGADYFALQDYPCEPDVLERYGNSAETHQHLSLEASAWLFVRAEEREIEAEPVCVLQGWDTQDYLDCIDLYREGGILTEYVGIGSVCRRNAEADIREVILAVADALPGHRLHAFGVKVDVLKYPDVVDVLTSADSLAYDWSYAKEIPGPRWHQVTHNYLEYKRKIADAIGRPDEAVVEDGQQRLGIEPAAVAAVGVGGDD